MRGTVRVAASALWVAGKAARNAVFPGGYFSSKRALEEENEALRAELAAHSALAGRLEVLERENEELRMIARVVQKEDGITAPIISSSNASPYGTFLIGAGALDGVAEGSVVLSGDERGFVIGRVAEAGARTSLVLEVFAPGASVEGFAGGATLSLEGRGGGNARAEVPRTIELSEGDAVTSGVFGGRIIGIVGAVSSGDSSALMRVYVRAPVSLSELQFVYVVPHLE